VDSRNSGGTAITDAGGSSPKTNEDSIHSEGTDDRDDDGSNQASKGHSKSKKVKKEKEDTQKGGVVQRAEQPQRSKSVSLFKRKKRSQSSQPPLSPNESDQPRSPQRRHTLSEGSQGSEVFTTTKVSQEVSML
jgi:hypothetical protein